MELIYNKVFLEHETGDHPESKDRLISLGNIPQTQIQSGERYLELVHTPKYIERVRKAYDEKDLIDEETVISKNTFNSAVHAVGASVMASETNGFALVRPPGHHAYPDMASGFCIFNNVAIAAQKCVNEGKKVFIFDFDGHLGDGTERFFYNSDKALYWSLHQFPAFPGAGNVDEIGNDKGKGYTINVPLPAGSGDDIYFKAVERFMPIAEQFKPDIVAVSAGFDAHQSDELLQLRLSYGAYYRLGKMLSERFKNLFAVLEGGYNTEALPKCLFNFVDGMNGKPQKHIERETDSMIQVMDEYEARANMLEKNLSIYWRL